MRKETNCSPQKWSYQNRPARRDASMSKQAEGEGRLETLADQKVSWLNEKNGLSRLLKQEVACK